MKVAEQRSLTREQKEAIGLLSIGTFLEYFDLMLFVHMAVVINEVFFPKTDPFTESLLSALSFCSLYVMRPLAALIFGYTGAQVIENNFYVASYNWCVVVFLILLTLKVHPLKILKVRGIILLIAMPICLFLLSNVSTATELFRLQLLLVTTSVCLDPAASVFYKHFPIFKRFRYSSFMHAISKIIVYITTSFGLVYLTDISYYGALVIMLPLGVLFLLSVSHFQKLEKVNKNRLKQEA